MEASILWGIVDYMKDHVYVLWLTVQTEVQVNSQTNKLKYLYMIPLPNSQIIPFLLSPSFCALSECLVYRIYEYNKIVALEFWTVIICYAATGIVISTTLKMVWFFSTLSSNFYLISPELSNVDIWQVFWEKSWKQFWWKSQNFWFALQFPIALHLFYDLNSVYFELHLVRYEGKQKYFNFSACKGLNPV